MNQRERLAAQIMTRLRPLARYGLQIRRYFRHLRPLQPQPGQLDQVRLDLIEESRLDTSYLILIIGSCLIATLGLLANSAAVIIGAMLIAPLMLPMRGLAFAALEGDIFLFRQSFVALTIGTGLAVLLSWALGSLAGIYTYGSEIWARSQPNLLDLGIAIAAGSISGYAKVQPRISGSLAGTAIAVALMPPICVIGLGLAQGNILLSWGALLLYLTNLLGITLACMVTFLTTGYAPFAQAQKALGLATLLTGLLLIPLGFSFVDLVRQSRLEASLREALLNRTVTFQQVELINTETNWLVEPPEVRLIVRSQEAVTPHQVALLEEFISQSMGQPFTLIFEVSQVGEVRRDSLPPPAKNP